MQLTAAEYSRGYSKVLKAFTRSQTSSWQEQVYRVKKNYRPSTGKLLFLFAYALSTWEHNDTAINYMTEDQVLSIFAKTTSL